MQSEIEKKVMGNVAAIYAGRKFVSAMAVKLYILCASLIAIASVVSVPHVFANLMQAGVTGFATFAFVAVLKTKLLVQIGLLVGCVVLASLIFEFFKNNTASRRRLAI